MPSDFKKMVFLRAGLTACEAAIVFAKRHAEKAEELAAQEKDPIRANELKRIAEVCRKVPANGAESFHEAVQSLWFTNYLKV